MTTSRLSTRRAALACFVAAALVLAACGGGGGDGGDEEADVSVDTTVAPTATTAPDLEPLFDDDMGDDANGWGESETDQFSAAFTAEGYEVSVDGTPSFFGYADDGPVDVADSTTTVGLAGPTDGGAQAGVSCRVSRTGPNAFYTLTVDPGSGAFTIARWSQAAPDEPVVLEEGIDEGLATSGPVEVAGTCLGQGDGGPVTLTLTVGGVEVASATDDDGLGAGFSGIAVNLDGTAAGGATFTSVDIAGEAGDGSLELEDDFSDPDSGFPELSGPSGTAGYVDGAYAFEMTGIVDAGVPVKAPIPDVGTITATLDGDLTDAFGGLCLQGDEGTYEFALSSDGYASIGLYPVDGEFVLLDEVTGAFAGEGPWRLSAGWNTNGDSSNLDVFVDDERLVSVNDDAVTGFSGLSFCGTVSQDAAAGVTSSYTYDDLVVVGEA